MGIATGRDKNISHVNLIVKEISKLFPVLCFGKFASIIHIFFTKDRGRYVTDPSVGPLKETREGEKFENYLEVEGIRV